MQTNQYLTEAAQHYHDKNYGDAITVASRGLERMQQDFHLLHLRANCLTALKEYKSALVDLKLLIRSYPSEPRAYLKAVKCYRNLKQANNALKILEYGRSRVDKNDIKYHELEEKENEIAQKMKNVDTVKIKEQGKVFLLPVELMTIVLWFLPLHDRLKISRVCQYWRGVVKGTTLLWRDVDLEAYTRKIDKKSLEFIINITKDRIFKLSLKNCSLISDLKSLITHRCRKMIYLDLSGTRVSSSALIDALKCMGKSLQVLILVDTRTDDLCLRRIFDICRALKVLNVSKCPLITNEGFTICDKFKQANISLTLEELQVTHMPDLSNISISRLLNAAPSICGIDLTGCSKISSHVLNILAQYSGWKWMVFGGNSFTSTEFQQNFVKLISICSNLERLELPNTPYLDDSSLFLIGKSCPKLGHINLKGCAHISGLGLLKLSKLLLKNLNVSKCPKISQDSILMLLESISSIQILDVSSVSDKLLEIVKQNANMRSLSISDGNITNRGIIDLIEKPGIKWENLHFSNCQKLSREAVSHLSSLAKGCKVTAYFS